MNEKKIRTLQLWIGGIQVFLGIMTATFAIMSLWDIIDSIWAMMGMALCVISCIVSVGVNVKRLQLIKAKGE